MEELTGALPSSAKGLTEESISSWFNDFVDGLKVDHFLLQTGTASQKTKDIYTAFIERDEIAIASEVRSSSSRFFIKRVLFEFIDALGSSNKFPSTLAFGISDSKVLVWCEIEDDDEATEDAILLAEAKINAKYHMKGIFISSMIIEKSDNLKVPPHYQIVTH